MTDLIRTIGRHWVAAVWLWLQLLLAGYLVYLDANPKHTYFAGLTLNGRFSDGIFAMGLMSVILFPGSWVVSALLEMLPRESAVTNTTAWLLAEWFAAALLTYIFWLAIARWARQAKARYAGSDSVSLGSQE